MNDIYLDVDAIPAERLEDMMTRLERRAATPQQAAALAAYLDRIEWPRGARVLDVGCGTGPQARAIAGRNGVSRVTGYDQIPAFVERAQALAEGLSNIDFGVSDAASLPEEDASADVVVLHTLLTHVPDPAAVLAEAHRVLKPGGQVAVYDGDFSTMSVAIGDGDPLQGCIDGFVEFNVNDKWLVRRLPAMLRVAGFRPAPTHSHGHLESDSPVLTLGWTMSGADYLAGAGRISEDAAGTLKREAMARAGEGRFYGFMNFVSMVARKAE